MVELMTTDLLSPNIYALFMMGTPRYLSVFLKAIICSVAVLAATNSEWVLTKCNTAVTDFPVTISWSKFASKNVVLITLFHNGLGISFGISSFTFP